MAIEIVEVGPRDGLQNEKAKMTVADKAALIRACAEAGLTKIEVGAFVNESRVPQMANSGEVIRSVGPLKGATGMVLIPNARRLRAFLAAREDAALEIPEIAVFVSATEGFSQANLNCSIDESFERIHGIFAALPGEISVRGYISCVTDCPYEGPVDARAVSRAAARLQEAGCSTLALADTIGKGTPERVGDALDAAMSCWAADAIAAHFHDTGGMALANVEVALGAGLRSFDAAVAGLGGCPYAPGAPGNLATEALVSYLADRGFETGVDPVALAKAAGKARQLVGR